ncbi:MAG: YIP1 family protein [candidate division KSB1 bacterium]|nr:YIP1 family protein [candidate division KSB1 bacterium]
MVKLFDRMWRASLLDVDLYEEVEADPTATKQAMAAVILSSVAAGIATLGSGGIVGLVAGAIGALIGWFIWAFLTYLIGTRLLPEETTEADLGQLLRTIGFSSSPGVIRVVGIVPPLRGLASFAAAVWMLVAMVLAVRQALDYRSTARAVLVCLLGWFVQLVIGAILLRLLS